MEKIGIGIIGAGNICPKYLEAFPKFPMLAAKAIADLNNEAAAARAAQFGIAVNTVEQLLGDPDIEIVLNLTPPQAHFAVSQQALAAGKHVYSEKPLALDSADGRRLLDFAHSVGKRLGVAPDTFLGGPHQIAREVVDSGRLGQIVGGTAYFMCPGHERWHPNPAFYYRAGGGPMFDMGPYYVTNLINMLGPVAAVSGFASRLRHERVITAAERKGEIIPVEVPTHVAGAMRFVNGAIVQLSVSFDVIAHNQQHTEIYGTKGSMNVPNPNKFNGEVRVHEGEDWREVPVDLPYAEKFNFRSLGLADMALAIRNNRPHRASGELGLHALEVMNAFVEAAETGRTIEITSTVERPEPIRNSIKNGALEA